MHQGTSYLLDPQANLDWAYGWSSGGKLPCIHLRHSRERRSPQQI